MEWTQLHGNNVVRRNLAYVAEPNFGENSVAGAAGAPNPFGGSYIQGLRFSVFELLQDLRQHVTLQDLRTKFQLLTCILISIKHVLSPRYHGNFVAVVSTCWPK